MKQYAALGLAAALAVVFMLPGAVSAKADKIEICHFNADFDPDAPVWELLEIKNNKARDKHVAHGDGFPGAAVPGMSGYVFDEACAPVAVGIDMEKLTNGSDADGANDADVPVLTPGDQVVWTYRVTNTGELPFLLAEVTVTDNVAGVTPVFDPASDAGADGILSPGEVWTFTASGTAADLAAPPQGTPVVLGCTNVPTQGDPQRNTYENVGTVVVPGDTDSDPSHYCNPPAPTFTETYSDSIPPTSTGWATPPAPPDPLTFPQFDDTSRTLTQVTITFDSALAGSTGAENVSTSSACQVTLNWGADISLDTTDGVLTSALGQTEDASLGVFDGVLDFGGPSGVTFDPLFQSGRQQQIITGAGLAPFIGGGTITLGTSANGTSSAAGCSNVVFQFTTDAAVDVEVEYTFENNP